MEHHVWNGIVHGTPFMEYIHGAELTEQHAWKSIHETAFMGTLFTEQHSRNSEFGGQIIVCF